MAIVFGSPEAQKIIAANKLAESYELLDWEKIALDVDVQILEYEASLTMDGRRFTTEGSTEDKAIDAVIAQAKQYLANKFKTANGIATQAVPA